MYAADDGGGEDNQSMTTMVYEATVSDAPIIDDSENSFFGL